MSMFERVLGGTAEETPDVPSYETLQHDTPVEVPVNRLDGALLSLRPYQDNPGIEAGANLLQSLHGVNIEQTANQTTNASCAHSFEVWYDARSDGEAAFAFRLYAANPRARERFQRKVEGSYPNTECEPVEQGAALPSIDAGYHIAGSELRLNRHTFLPIRHHSADGFPHGDPYTDVLQEMATVDDSLTVLQVMFKPAPATWTKNGPGGQSVADVSAQLREPEVQSLRELDAWRAIIFDGELEARQPQEKDKQAAKIVENQRGEQGFYVNVRIMAASQHCREATERVYGIGDIFSKYYNSATEQGFQHRPIPPDRLSDLYRRMVFREYEPLPHPMILTTDELAGLAHIPSNTDEATIPQMPWKKTQAGETVSSQKGEFESDADDRRGSETNADTDMDTDTGTGTAGMTPQPRSEAGQSGGGFAPESSSQSTSRPVTSREDTADSEPAAGGTQSSSGNDPEPSMGPPPESHPDTNGDQTSSDDTPSLFDEADE